MIVLDTNVLSELTRIAPSIAVFDWLASQPPSRIFTTAITQAELLYGIELMSSGKRRATLQAAIELMLTKDFANHILPFDSDAALDYARIYASRRAAGRPILHADAQIAAIVHSRGAILATRNIDDFAHCGIKVVNPWGAS